MKRLILMAFAAMAMFSCQKENSGPNASDKASVANIKINVNRVITRDIEGGHPGAADNTTTVNPKIFAVTVISYNEYGAEIGRTDLSTGEIKDALFGNYRDSDGNAGSNTTANDAKGVSVGLPVGATKVDVILNCPTPDHKAVTNINYFNYRDNTNGSGDAYANGDDNLDRVYLVTDNYGSGVELKGNETPGTTNQDVPSYTVAFKVRPYMARMEVFGGINVADYAVWIDYYNNHWSTMSLTDYLAATKEQESDADDKGNYKYGTRGTGTLEDGGNGFDKNTVYISEYYWHKTSGSVGVPQPRTGKYPAGNTLDTEADIDDPSTPGEGWVPNPYYDAAKQVRWLPNRFYAVDVEEIFINNIKVRDITYDPYLHPWPGSQSAVYWTNWYNAFHTAGWHTAGTSASNTFLCMGNMWDRIASSKSVQSIAFPALNGTDHMDVITGKAEVIAGKSKFYSTQRNLGVEDAKAAAYQIYPQAKKSTTGANDKDKLMTEMPHIVLKVKAYDNATDYAAGKYVASKEFITVKLFSQEQEGKGSYLTTFEKGNIYRFNLNDLLYSFIGNVPVPGGRHPGDVQPTDPVDPDPEMPGAELIVKVQVLPWTVQNMYPVI